MIIKKLKTNLSCTPLFIGTKIIADIITLVCNRSKTCMESKTDANLPCYEVDLQSPNPSKASSDSLATYVSNIDFSDWTTEAHDSSCFVQSKKHGMKIENMNAIIMLTSTNCFRLAKIYCSWAQSLFGSKSITVQSDKHTFTHIAHHADIYHVALTRTDTTGHAFVLQRVTSETDEDKYVAIQSFENKYSIKSGVATSNIKPNIS